MKLSTRLLFVILILIGFACGPNAKEENQKLRDEVIAIHDEVMPLMGKLKSLEKDANSLIEEIEAAETVDSVRITDLKALAYDLNQAYDGMFVWMRQYETEDGELSDEEVKSYLDDQMVKVTKVNEDITAALEKADLLLRD